MTVLRVSGPGRWVGIARQDCSYEPEPTSTSSVTCSQVDSSEACLPDSVGDTACALAVPKHEVVSLRSRYGGLGSIHSGWLWPQVWAIRGRASVNIPSVENAVGCQKHL